MVILVPDLSHILEKNRGVKMSKKTEMIVFSIMGFILAIAIAIQINTVSRNGSTISTSQSESNLKTQVLKMKEKYESQYSELERVEEELEKIREQVTNNNEELSVLESKIKTDNILLGNTDVKGTGVTITLTDGTVDSQILDPDSLIVHAENVINVINELKNAGASAISINGQRIVNTTAIPCDGNVIIVNGIKISTPIQISALGKVEVLSTLNRPGGILEKFLNLGKGVELKKNTNIEIPKFTGVISFKYAKNIK